MNWNTFSPYGLNPSDAFETMCNQLFERYVKRVSGDKVQKFRVVNGEAGDGGVEAYGVFNNNSVWAVQSKWFRDVLKKGQFEQIEDSIDMAIDIRPEISKYIICIPRDINSLKYGRGKSGEEKKLVTNHEDSAVESFEVKIKSKYPDLKLEWWFDHQLTQELSEITNEGVNKFWFGQEVLTIHHLTTLFNLKKVGWMHLRYVPKLHLQGVIHNCIEKLRFSKVFRDSLLIDLKEFEFKLEKCLEIVNSYGSDDALTVQLREQIDDFSKILQSELLSLSMMITAAAEGNDDFVPKEVPLFDVNSLSDEVSSIKPRYGKYGIKEKLMETFAIYVDFKNQNFDSKFFKSVQLIMGAPGTGKTHGLANSVDLHLSNLEPAVIIQAKGASNKDWTSLLSSEMSLPGWSQEEILSALEALAVRCDLLKAKKIPPMTELISEKTKVLICVDGLEEDIDKEDQWYALIREATLLTEAYPRIKFIFSARNYFHKVKENPQSRVFESLLLPSEGDVPIYTVAEKYFSEEHFNIRLEQKELIKGLDSLFALSLFCEQYKDRHLTKSDIILTATSDLLYKKILRMEESFTKMYPGVVSSIRTPITDSLNAIAEAHYTKRQLNQSELDSALKNSVGSYLENFERIIDFLIKNGLIIKNEESTSNIGLRKKNFVYSMINNSVIEFVIAFQVIDDLVSEKIDEIPELYKKPVTRAESESSDIIVQTVVDHMFMKGKLIGDSKFLTKGLSDEKIKILRLRALQHSVPSQYMAYKKEIESLLLTPGKTQYQVLSNLILPSSRYAGNIFGALFLHGILLEQPTSFERDKVWSGTEPFENSYDTMKEFSIAEALENYLGKDILLPSSSLHSETPLVMAWALSNISQKLRNDIRISLAIWALNQPSEFEKLLDLLFDCNDPQIQEDFSSIMRAIAATLKDTDAILSLANWSLENVFSSLNHYRNVIVRQGMRSIVEKAHQYDLISNSDLEKCRPKIKTEYTLIPLDKVAIEEPKEEIYPIVHDLAWNVIDKVYDLFFEDEDENEEGQRFLDEYRRDYDDTEIYSRSWTMAAAIAYIRNLGFDRVEGNHYTEESHGSKSSMYTFEEKYTWLAVHYLQGYLSDFLSITKDNGAIVDYSILTPIPNPGESILFQKALGFDIENSHWIIQDFIVEEKDESQTSEYIRSTVESNPQLNFINWIEFESEKFSKRDENRNMIALYNKTAVHDSNNLVYTKVTIWAGIMKSEEIQLLTDLPNQLSFAEHLESLEAKPNTHIYCNASDLIWMNWVNETETASSIYLPGIDEAYVLHCLTEVTNDSIEGEKYSMIPSKKVRDILEISEVQGRKFMNSKGDVMAIHHQKKDGKRNSQEILVVDKELFLEALKEKQLQLVWFVEHFQQTNVHNKSIPDGNHHQKVRKYFVKNNDQGYEYIKFWDSRFSN